MTAIALNGFVSLGFRRGRVAASALLLRQHLEDESTRLTFVSSDRELKDAAEASRLTLIDPEEPHAASGITCRTGATRLDTVCHLYT
jgi:hypothetical protein